MSGWELSPCVGGVELACVDQNSVGLIMAVLVWVFLEPSLVKVVGDELPSANKERGLTAPSSSAAWVDAGLARLFDGRG